MVSPTAPSGSPYAIHLATPGDVVGLVFESGSHHLGTAPRGSARYDYSEARGFEVFPVGRSLVPGDVYLASMADWIVEALAPGSLLGEAAKIALRAASLFADASPIAPLTFPAIAYSVPNYREFPMPTQAHLSCVWSGVFGTPEDPQEVWSFGLKCSMPAADQTGPALDAIAVALHTAYQATLNVMMTNKVSLTAVTIARVGADGHWERFPDGAWKVGRDLTHLTGNSQQPTIYPLQTALVISLVTSRPGSTGRGRMFLPLQGHTLDAKFLLNDTSWAGFTAEAVDFVRRVGAAAGPVQVVSSKGYSSPVTGIRVGGVPDTQRSRRNRLIEGYRSEPLAP